ncbi:pollen-specific leucine-rich repeat extensin-like protein 1 [Quillaja saponaria]|uniref:Pollen-specific leucine-rich repeat extensin-like protein 1 n=1 Tax=Quillaja saponaria TaxID=32244 RepID=A0AAD7LM31_QUISA|nr:pollen-specific leucine-rich repeat extensin-like protein 1 [Quillaja saponaria]
MLASLIIGGTWACCKLAKRGWHVDGVPYQELEMGQADPITANNVETAEGWDQDWEEINTAKSPNTRQIGNDFLIKTGTNGLASRFFDRDGWEMIS